MPKPSRVLVAAGQSANRSLVARAGVLEALMRSTRQVPQRNVVATHHANAVSTLLVQGVGEVADFSLIENRVSVLVAGITLHVRLTALRTDAAAVVGAAIKRRLEEVAA